MISDNIIKKASEIGIDVQKHQSEQFQKYFEILTEWNKFMNLTAIKDEDGVLNKHFIDSVAVLKKGYIKSGDSVLDVGTGAGFPGLPIKIMMPDIKLVLLDSLQKRLKFLNEVINKLGIQDVSLYHGRAEEYSRKKEFREKFDIVTARGVAELNKLAEITLPFVKVGGLFMAYKGPAVFEETKKCENAFKILGAECREIVPIVIPETDLEHYVAIIKKIHQTPTIYPRNTAKIEKTPL